MANLPPLPLAAALLAAALAVLTNLYLRRRGVDRSLPPPAAPPPAPSSSSSSVVYAIGDLHGDVDCAMAWVRSTGLIDGIGVVGVGDGEYDPSEWRWNEDEDPPSSSPSSSSSSSSSSIVFLGDYVDKGPTSRQTVEFVKDLTDRFPDRVVAIMGNHELELLRDRDEESSGRRWGGGGGGGGGGFFRLPYATVHPGEYLNYIHPGADHSGGDGDGDGDGYGSNVTDEVVVEVLYNASLEVYSMGHREYARMAPPPPGSVAIPSTDSKFDYYRRYGYVPITEYVHPPELRDVVSDRLESYQRSYLDAYRSGSTLGGWIESRPPAYLSDDGTLFVHGGISRYVVAVLRSLVSSPPDGDRGGYGDGDGDGGGIGGGERPTSMRDAVGVLNRLFLAHSRESDLTDFMDSTDAGRAVEELVNHRGNHPDRGAGGGEGEGEGEGACDELRSILGEMGGVERVAVGHTPGRTVRVHCGGRLLALDSMLGRWIRASGNDYCPSSGSGGRGGGARSRDGRYVCPPVGERCEGQIVRLVEGGKVEVIRAP